MVTEELLAYIKRQQANRVPEESIRAILLANGWLKIDVDKAFDSLFKVQESKVVTAQDLHEKVASFTPRMSAQAGSGIVGQGGDFVSSGSPTLVKDSYREPIDNTIKEQYTSKSIGTPVGKELPVDLKERLRKISSDSIFAPQKEIVNPVTSTPSNPFIQTGEPTPPNFQDPTDSYSAPASSLAGSSNFPIKRETVMSQPLSSLHMIENNSIKEQPMPDQNRLYARFGGATSPYSPSMDKFNSPLAAIPQKKSHKGFVLFFIFVLVVVGGGYYLMTYKQDLVRSLLEKFQVQEIIDQAKEISTPKDNADVEKNENNIVSEKNEPVVEPNPEPIAEPTSIPSAETALTDIVSKASIYVGLKSTTRGVCSNISSGIAKDLMSLKSTYGTSVMCLDDANGFVVTVPSQDSGEYMCVDAGGEIMLVKSIPKTTRCM